MGSLLARGKADPQVQILLVPPSIPICLTNLYPKNMASRLEEMRSQREAILRVVVRNKAFNVSVFGSVARGEEKPDSDIDLLVDFLPEASLIDQFRLQEELTKLLKTPVDVISRRSLKPRDHDIRNEAMAL